MPSDSPRPDDSSSRASSKGTDRTLSEASGRSDDGQTARRGRRSRPKVKTGCSNCKQRRIKCDEARPSCTQCIKGKKTCTGYPPPPRNARPEYEVRIAPRPLAANSSPAPAPSPSPLLAVASSPNVPASNEPSGPRFLSREMTLPPRRGSRRAPGSSTSSPAPEASSSSSSLPPPPAPLPLVGTDGFYFQIFQEQTAGDLSGFFDSVFFKERVLEASHTEPAIRHAAIALGALYKTWVQSWGNSSTSSESPREPGEQLRHWQVAVRQYSEACNAMMAMGDASQNSLRTQLMASVLLATFDSFIGDHRQAIVQIQNGLDLHERIRTAERLPAYGVATDTVEEELTIIFMRLAIQAKSYDLGFHFPEPYVVRFTSPAQHQARLQRTKEQQQQAELDTDLYSAHSSPGAGYQNNPASSSGGPETPLIFANLDEARVAHDRLNERLVRLQESMNIRPRAMSRMVMPEAWMRAIASFKEQLASWAQAFAPLLMSRTKPHVSRRERAGIAVLQMAHLTAAMISAIQFSSNELVFDKYMSVCRAVVDLGIEIVREEDALGVAACQAESAYCPHQRHPPPDYIESGVFSACHIKPTFSMDLGIVAPLFVVATKCRHRHVRRQAIELLRSCSRREGMWDSDLTARIAHWVMTVEETPLSDTAFGNPQVPATPPSIETYIGVPPERRVMIKSIDFDLRARWANVVVGTRNVDEGMPDPRYRATQITW